MSQQFQIETGEWPNKEKVTGSRGKIAAALDARDGDGKVWELWERTTVHEIKNKFTGGTDKLGEWHFVLKGEAHDLLQEIS